MLVRGLLTIDCLSFPFVSICFLQCRGFLYAQNTSGEAKWNGERLEGYLLVVFVGDLLADGLWFTAVMKS
jgi:hypothetical protein